MTTARIPGPVHHEPTELDPPAATGPDLAHRVGGTWLPGLDMILLDGMHHIACKPGTGKVFYDTLYQLGTMADSVEHLAGQYAVFVAAQKAAA